jgi:hypothetical protein
MMKTERPDAGDLAPDHHVIAVVLYLMHLGSGG